MAAWLYTAGFFISIGVPAAYVVRITLFNMKKEQEERPQLTYQPSKGP